MSTPYPDPLVVRLARENRRALLAREDLQMARMAKQWIQIERSLQGDMLLLAQDILAAKEAGKAITEQLIAKMDRYKVLNASLKQQVLAYTKDKVAKDITAEQLAYAQHGLDGAIANINAQATFGITFNTLSVDQLTDLAGMLGDGTPLNRLLKEAYPESLDGIVKALLEGSARGLGIKEIATYMARRMGMGLERITLIARTEQLRAWRIATQRQYEESGVVMWHERLCAKDPRTCMACLMADGEKIPIDQVLSDHPRGRCTSIPIVKGAPPIVREMGQEWFDRQSPAVQKEMLGPGMYDLWQKQGFALKDLRGVSVNNVWGNSPRVRTLQEMTRRSKQGVAMSVNVSNAGRTAVKFQRPLASGTGYVFDGTARVVENGKFLPDTDPRSQELKNDINVLLASHPEAAGKIRYIYQAADMKSFVQECEQVGLSKKDAKDVLAFFSRQYDTIVLRPGPITTYTFDHEVGHAVWKNSNATSGWNRLFREDPKFDRHTNYSKTSGEESFCETYAAWIASGRSTSWDSFLEAAKVVTGVRP